MYISITGKCHVCKTEQLMMFSDVFFAIGDSFLVECLTCGQEQPMDIVGVGEKKITIRKNNYSTIKDNRIIRCRDCKHLGEASFCSIVKHFVQPDYFCWLGERRVILL